MKNIKFSFEEPVSKSHKDSVLNAIQIELNYNKKRSSTPILTKGWLSLPLALAFIAVVYFQFVNPLNKNTDLNVALSDNLLIELAALSPEEVEIVEDLDFIEALDKMSSEELEEILL